MKEWWLNNWKVLVPIIGAVIAGLFTTFGILLKHWLDKRKHPTAPPKPLPSSLEKEDSFIQPKRPNYEYNLGEIASERGEYEQALRHYIASAKAYEKIKRLSYSHDHAASLIAAGVACNHLEQYEDSIKYYDQARAIWEIDREKNKHKIAWVWNNMGVVFGEQNKNDDAIGMFRNAIEIKENMPMEDDVYTAGFYTNLATALCIKGNEKEALIYYQRAHDVFEKIYGSAHLLTANACKNIGDVLARQGKYSDAMCNFQKALDTYEIDINANYMEIAEIYSTIGAVLGSVGEFQEALDIFLKAYRACRGRLSEDHPQMQEWLKNLKLVHKLTGRKNFNRWLLTQLADQKGQTSIPLITASQKYSIRSIPVSTSPPAASALPNQRNRER